MLTWRLKVHIAVAHPRVAHFRVFVCSFGLAAAFPVYTGASDLAAQFAFAALTIAFHEMSHAANLTVFLLVGCDREQAASILEGLVDYMARLIAE